MLPVSILLRFTMARAGYTLPVFAVAAAKAALLHLQDQFADQSYVRLDLISEAAEVPIQQVARLDANSALAVTLSDPGDNLDLTRNTPIWAWVKRESRHSQALILEAGEGLGRTATGAPAIYQFARHLFEINLLPLIASDQTVRVIVILPEGRQLAQRTSNQAFGILEGLALLGTSAISQPLSAEEHLKELRQVLQTKAVEQSNLVFCIGSNGMLVAQQLGIQEASIVQTGNWIGALLIEAALRAVKTVLLLGYQGKLVKLAGGIFNTSSHLADAKLEIISAAVVQAGGSLEAAQAVLNAKTADAAYKTLIDLGMAEAIFQILAHRISQRAADYVYKYANVTLKIGTLLFDRKGVIISRDNNAIEIIQRHCSTS